MVAPIVHNRELAADVREENEEFNRLWILKNELIGANNVSVDELDVAENTKGDASPFMVVWLKNIERLCEMFNSEFNQKSFSLLDVGCGSGISTIFFLQNYGFERCEGFDFS